MSLFGIRRGTGRSCLDGGLDEAGDRGGLRGNRFLLGRADLRGSGRSFTLDVVRFVGFTQGLCALFARCMAMGWDYLYDGLTLIFLFCYFGCCWLHHKARCCIFTLRFSSRYLFI